METVWNRVFSLDLVEPDLLKKGTDRVILRRNLSKPTEVQCAMYSPSNLIQKFTQLRIMLKGNCQSLKLYYDEKLDCSHAFKEFSFQQIKENAWVKSNDDYELKVIMNPSYTDSHLVLEISSKRGGGIPSTVCNFVTLFESHLQQAMEVAVS